MGYAYLKLIDIGSDPPDNVIGYALQYSVTGQIIRPFYQEGKSTFETPNEIAVLFGINRIEKFLPDDYRIVRKMYKEFLHFVEHQIYQEYNIKINFVEWDDETDTTLYTVFRRKPRKEKYEEWQEGFFAGHYEAWLDEHSSVLHPEYSSPI
jgi:hypothetical protein